jgi:hypothetical protein
MEIDAATEENYIQRKKEAKKGWANFLFDPKISRVFEEANVKIWDKGFSVEGTQEQQDQLLSDQWINAGAKFLAKYLEGVLSTDHFSNHDQRREWKKRISREEPLEAFFIIDTNRLGFNTIFSQFKQGVEFIELSYATFDKTLISLEVQKKLSERY